MSGIRLSEKYGVNPSVSTCIICGKDDAVVLFGRAWRDETGHEAEAPRSCGVISPEPCPACRKKYLEEGDGVLLAEAKMVERPHHNPSRRWNGEKESFPQITGECAVIKRAAFEEVFPSFPVPSRRIAFVEPGVLARILPNPETEGKEAKS